MIVYGNVSEIRKYLSLHTTESLMTLGMLQKNTETYNSKYIFTTIMPI